MKNGEIKRYYPNGQLREISNYKNGLLEGEYKWYYDNGQLEEISNWKNDRLDGENKRYSYSDNEKLERISYWKNGIDVTEQVLAKRELLEEIISLHD
jgi:antitoxin component YwqK of YwqJK toxin-antitoxin module